MFQSQMHHLEEQMRQLSTHFAQQKELLPRLMAEECDREMDKALRAQQLNQQPPVARPKQSEHQRKALLQQWTARKLGQSRLAREGMALRKTVISGKSHASFAPTDALESISLSQMRVPSVHSGRVLVCRTVVEPLAYVGAAVLVQDLNGDIEHLALYNFSGDLNDVSWLPRGTILLIKEPHLKYGVQHNSGDSNSESTANSVFIRVDSPSDVHFVDSGDEEALRKVGALRWHRPETEQFEQLKRRGNQCFGRAQWAQALHFYARAERIRPESAEIHSNRAAAQLKLCRFYEAHQAAMRALECENANREKLLFRLGKAAYGMRNWEEADRHYGLLSTDFPNNTAARAEFQRAMDRGLEARTGLYDLNRLYEAAVNRGQRQLDAADYYTGPIQIAPIPGKGKGVVATADIERGTLLAACKAFSIAHPLPEDDPNGCLFCVNLYTKRVEKPTNMMNIFCAVQTLRRNPQWSRELYSLYAGDDDANRGEKNALNAIPEGVIDVARIERICSLNAFDCRNPSPRNIGADQCFHDRVRS